MPIKRVEKIDENLTNIVKLRMGQIAQITHWHESSFVGRFILRYQDSICFIGQNNGYYNFYKNITEEYKSKCWVEVLEPGTLLEITK